MRRVVGWHTGLGETTLRLSLINLLWIAFTLAGAVVLGIFPATSAAMGVLRRDAMDRRAEAGGAPATPRAPLHREFADLWRREFRSANGLGWVVTPVWALLAYEYWILGNFQLGLPGGAVEAVLLLAMLVLFVMTSNLWVLQAHFAEGPFALLRRSLILTVGRPASALLVAAGVLGVAAVYVMMPGLGAVFGIAAAAFLATGHLWGAGILAPSPSHAASGV
ncbi:YesL family protein [Tessaracoccus sp. Z1128]